VSEVVKFWHGIPVIDAAELISRIERPERSGTIGVLTMLLLLWGFDPNAQIGDLTCTFMPWKCQTEARKEAEHKERLTPIYLGRGSGKEKACTCHWEVKKDGDAGTYFGEMQDCSITAQYYSDVEIGIWHRPPVPPRPSWCAEDSCTFTAFVFMTDNVKIVLNGDDGEYRIMCDRGEGKE